MNVGETRKGTVTQQAANPDVLAFQPRGIQEVSGKEGKRPWDITNEGYDSCARIGLRTRWGAQAGMKSAKTDVGVRGGGRGGATRGTAASWG